MKSCPICTSAVTRIGFTTCGRSRCQEAAYRANLARNARKGARKTQLEREAHDAALRACADVHGIAGAATFV